MTTASIWRSVNDPFGTEALRSAVLSSWADSPTRFREDANAEEDLLLGGYADRWLVELAQNAADAAQRAQVPGRLLVRVVATDGGPELRVANTGAPLDAAGVAALASLRASTKRDSDEVGRFGVGFAAVLGVGAEPRIVSSSGAVAFSRARTVAQVRALGGVAARELAGRGDRPPVLRLCWPTDEPGPPPGYDTEIRLRLPASEPETGVSLSIGESLDSPPRVAGFGSARLLSDAEAAADDLLLALPRLVEITVGEVRHRRRDDPTDGQDDPADGGPGGVVRLEPSGARWLLARRAGRLAAGVDEAVEGRTGWSVCWALPLSADGAPRPLDGDVLHAPTPSDERLGLPARLFATLPMQPSRRRIRTGPATDAVLAEAAAAYLDLLRALPPSHRLLVAPRPGFPRSELDELLRAALTTTLSAAPWLPAARPAGGTEPGVTPPDLAPRDAVWLEPAGSAELTGLLAELVPGLLADDVEATARPSVLAALGARPLPPAELTDLLASLARPPGWWYRLYAALAPVLDARPGVRDELAALPVPLVDGRTVTGPRSALTLAGVPPVLVEELVEEVRLTGLRVVHPDAAHPLLHRLGADDAGPAELLDHPSVVEAVERSVADAQDGVDTGPLVRLVLGLVDEIGTAPNRPWLAGLALPDAGGEPRRADELMLPDAALAPLLEPDAPLGVLAADVREEYPRRVLTSVGVLDSFALVLDEQPTGPDHELADEHLWWDSVEPAPARLVAVRDLDLVRDDAWPSALALLGADPELRAALRRRPGQPEPYTAWWLARHARLAGRRPGHWRLPDAVELAGLYDPVPALAEAPLDGELLAAVGVRRQLTVTDTEDAGDLLARLADPDRELDAALTWLVHDRLAEAVLAGLVDTAALEPPSRVRAVDGAVADAGDAVLLDRTWLADALDRGETVAGRLDEEGIDALAELLDLPLASEVVEGRISDGDDVVAVRWSGLPEVVEACSALGVPVPPGTLLRHRTLTVELTRPTRARPRVPVWVQDGQLHADDPVRALVCAIANGLLDRSANPPHH